MPTSTRSRRTSRRGATQLTLPNDENLLVFAVSAAGQPGVALAGAPLADMLADHRADGLPTIPQAGENYHDSTAIHILAPLYHGPDDLRYTLDGSDPKADSPVYRSPFFLSKTATVKARQVLPGGGLDPVVTGIVNVQDTTPPTLLTAKAEDHPNEINLTFSEPLDRAAAGRVDTYTVSPGMAVRGAKVSDDGKVVTLTLGADMSADARYGVEAHDVTDMSGNRLAAGRFEVSPLGLVYSKVAVKLPDEHFTTKVENLPSKASDAWTINLLVKPDTAPEEHTLIGGFGHAADTSHGPGLGRYFGVFKDGIRFWVALQDVVTNSPLEVGRWQMLTATYDGKVLTVYKDGQPIGKKEETIRDDGDNTVGVGLADAWGNGHLLDGRVQAFTIRRGALAPDQVKKLAVDTKPF